MASTNFKLFDENKTNMMSDTEYNINTQRLNGVQAGIASSQLQNKTLHQTSLVAYSLAQIMMQNGYDANDSAAVSAFVSNMSNSLLQKVLDKATADEAKGGTNNTKYITPATMKAAVDLIIANKQDKITGAASTITSNNLSANRALISNSNGKVEASGISSTKLGYLTDVTGNIQAQLNKKVSTSSMNLNTGKFKLVKTFSASSPTYTLTNDDVLGRGFFFDTSSCTLVPENSDVYSMIVKIIKPSEGKSILMAQNHIAGGGGQAVSASLLGNTTYSFAVNHAHGYDNKYSGTFMGMESGLVTLNSGDGLELKFISCTSSNLTVKMYRIT